MIEKIDDGLIVSRVAATRDDLELVRLATQLYGKGVTPYKARDRLRRWIVRRMSGRTLYCPSGAIHFCRSGTQLTWFDRLALSLLNSGGTAETPENFVVTADYLSFFLYRSPEEIAQLSRSRSGIQGFDL